MEVFKAEAFVYIKHILVVMSLLLRCKINQGSQDWNRKNGTNLGQEVNEWMTCDFIFRLTVYQSYQAGRKGPVVVCWTESQR